MIYRLSGIVTIPEVRYEYGLFENSTSDIKYFSIDNFLNSIYKNSPTARIIIEIKKRIKNNKKVFEYLSCLEGQLFKAKNKNGVYDWHVGKYNRGTCLGDVFFDNVGEYVKIALTDVDYKKYVTDTELLQEVLYGEPLIDKVLETLPVLRGGGQ